MHGLPVSIISRTCQDAEGRPYGTLGPYGSFSPSSPHGRQHLGPCNLPKRGPGWSNLQLHHDRLSISWLGKLSVRNRAGARRRPSIQYGNGSARHTYLSELEGDILSRRVLGAAYKR
jgi:hypothetical protein